MDRSHTTRCSARRLALILCMFGVCREALAQNDACEDAGSISGTGVFAFDNAAATQDGPGHAACAEFGQPDIDRDIWYCWTSACDDLVTIETCGETGVDTKLAVYDGCGCPPGDGNLLDCSDDACGLQSSVSFAASSGQSYLVRIGSAPGSSGGSGNFSIACATPTEDHCAGAIAIAGEGSFAFDNGGAGSSGPDHPGCEEFGQPDIDHDVWFQWESTCDGDVLVQTCGLSAVDTKLAVYPASACPPTDAALISCNDDACGPQSQLTFAASSGSSYLIRTGTSPGAAGGTGSINVSCAPAGGGADNCAAAEDIVSTAGPIAFDNTAATRDGPAHALCLENGQSDLDHDTWFHWTADCSGEVSVETCGQTSTDSRVAVYEDTACPPQDAQLVACNDDACGLQSAAAFTATSGRDYLIRVGVAPSSDGGTGTFTLSACDFVDGGANSCNGAQTIVGPGTFDFDLTNATTDGPPDLSCPATDRFPMDHDVWFDWTADCTGEVVIESCNATSVDTRLAVYADSVCPPTAERVMDCDDDACGLQSSLHFTSLEGHHYLIRVGTPQGVTGGPGALTISTCAPIDGAADSCVAAPTTSGFGSIPFDNTVANQDGPAHPDCLPFGEEQIAHDVWYCWTSDIYGRVTLSTCGQTGVDTRLAVYEGCGCPATDARLLACDDDACGPQSNLELGVVAGQQYLVRVGTHPTANGGTGSLTIEGIAVPAVSTWGLALLLLTVLTAGTLVLRSRLTDSALRE